MSAAPLPALVRTELLLHRRHGVLAATAAMTGTWAVVLLLLPQAWRADAVPWVLFLDLAALGFFFVPALAVTERGNGVTAALGLTRLSPARALAVRLATLAGPALVASAVLAAVGGVDGVPATLAGAILTNLLLSLVATVMVGRADTLTTYFARVPVVAVPLVVPALLRATDVTDAAVLAVSPLTGAFELMAGRWSWASAAWIAAWIAGLGRAAVAVGFDVTPETAAVSAAPRSAPGGARPRRGGVGSTPAPGGPGRMPAVRSLARVDRRSVLGDRMLLLLVAGVPLLAGIVRWLGGPGLSWVRQRYGVDLEPHLPLVWAFVLVLHTPTMLGAVTGLLFLEDRAAGLLPALATTRASLRTVVGYRLAATVVASAGLVALAVPLAGAGLPAGLPGLAATVVAAGAVATVPAMLLGALARDRVQGMALMKVMSLPLYLPVAWWFFDGRLGWLFAAVPTGAAARAFWSASAATAWALAAVAVVGSASIVALLLPRLRATVIG